ncbi:MAG: hypothetical protein A2070_03195 [Bdellovibrionales bacterium GWC1_52_8]|nr:MAG: hypothetical protein A2Z97_13250 [Bdellovibrionales bacterium GWB1_52_6]OFZ05799.1 MAG: hypothetical protein A2X97_03800 [Bdellovibrionales bacterium GWA1_52_35]OFZ35590.1 MAG: hypothetical protein A2070_03195 [Bdellovibrionales bacterium GWC1_52_8]
MNLQRPGISALIISRNEERHIERCLSSLIWANEILVVDALSTDQTKAKCLRSDAPWASKLRFIENKWEGFRKQRNLSLDSATHDWVLVVDADEACSPELAERIQSLLSATPDGPPFKAYKVHRAEYFLGKPIRYGIWNPSYQDRFFHRQGVRYINEIHEYPNFPSDPGRIHEPLLHSPEFNIEKFLDKMNRYTSIEARDRILQGKRTNIVHLLGSFPAMFLKNYFYYSSWRDGWHGLIISLLEGVSRVVRHIKMWNIQTHPEKHR